MTDYFTHEHPGDYEVTFCTEDKATYEAVEKFCRQMLGHLKPDEPKYELRPTAKWSLKEAYPKIFLNECSNCGEYAEYNNVYCPHCGAKMENGC